MPTEDSSPIPRPSGPIDLAPWPDKLRAHVVSVDGAPRIHGYAVGADLAACYGFAEVLLLSMLGELPTDEAAAALNAGLVALSPVGINEGPCRAGLLAHLTAGDPRAAIEVGWVALAERASTLLETHAPTLAWLDGGSSGPTPAGPDGERPDPELHGAWGSRCRSIKPEMGRVRTGLCLLHHAGLTDRDGLLLAICIAGIGTVTAEASRGAKAGFKGHPSDLPTTRVKGSSRG